MTHEDFLQAAAATLPHYQSSVVAREHLAQVDLIAIIGPSGVGKSTIIKSLGIPLVPSDMTRDKRIDEIDGEDASFRTDYDRMNEEIVNGDFAQFVIGPDGEFYATRAASYPAKGPATMPLVASALPAMRQIGFRTVVPIFVAVPTFEEWMRRFAERSMPIDRQQKRLHEAKESLERSLADAETIFVLNDSVSRAVADIKHIVSDNRSYSADRALAAKSAATEMLRALTVAFAANA